ncbi:MAG: hypothetical protein K2Q26_06370 [Bdellovibrionales bacterium]|nr:hypothetical protein [Bdellovibrionales bacterium]
MKLWKARYFNSLVLSSLLMTASLEIQAQDANSTSAPLPADAKGGVTKAPTNPTATKTKVTNVALTGEVAGNLTKPWMMSIDINHLPETRDDNDAVTEMSLLFDYLASPTHTFRLIQGVQKLYEIRPGQSEVYPSDTTFSHLWRSPWQAAGVKFIWVNSLTLPISEDSQNRDLLTTATSQLRFNYAVDRFFFSFRPFARYHAYEFKTSPEGDLLPLYTLGASLLSTASITDRLTLVASFAYTSVYLTASEFSSRSTVEPESQGRYSIDLSLNYDWTHKISTYLYYGAGDSYILDGRYEINVYDPRTTRAGIGATLNF